MIKLVIKGSLTDLNTYINAERGNRFVAAKIKKEETDLVYWECKKQKLYQVAEYPVNISFVWYCKNEKKDPDNISFTKKYILDGLVKAEVLQNDGFKQINSFTDSFEVDSENPRIEVFIV